MSKKPIFSSKNKLTNTSLAALIIIGVENPNVKHLLISLMDGKALVSTF